MTLIQRDHEIQAFATNRPHQSFAEDWLEEREVAFSNSDSKIFDGLIQLRGKSAMPIVNPSSIWMLNSDGLAKLLQCPVRGRMSRNVAVQNSARTYLRQNEYIKDAETSGDCHHEVTSHDGLSMVTDEAIPGL